MKRKVSISIYCLQLKYGDMRALEIAKEIGADAVDYSLDFWNSTPVHEMYDYRVKSSPYYGSDEDIIAYFTNIKKHADELGIEICQTHGRGAGFKNIPDEDADLIRNARIDCLATKTLGAPVCVIHAVTSIFMGPNPDPQLMHDLNFDMFNKILVFAKQYGIKVATETFGDAVEYDACDFFGQIEEFMKTYNRIRSAGDNAKYFTTCVDTGHSNKAMRYGNPTAADVIRRIGSDISVLHLNDNDTFTDQHKIPCTGTIDFNDVFNALDEVGYNGVYNMEIGLGQHFGEGFEIEEAEFAIKVMRHILKQRYGE